jgi:hypothetical protein
MDWFCAWISHSTFIRTLLSLSAVDKMHKTFWARCTRLSFIKVLFVIVLVMDAVRNFALLRPFITLEEEDAISIHSSSNRNRNTAANDMEATSNGKNRNKQQKRIQWTDAPLQIPTPVLLASLPKSGTTSIWRYFDCGGQKASHHQAIVNETWSNKTVLGTGDKVSGKAMVSGLCMKWNVLAGRPLLEGCGDYDVWTDTGAVAHQHKHPSCYYPGIQGLEEWFKSYPNSTIMLTTRSVDSWVDSASRWGEGSLVWRWDQCNLTGYLGKKAPQMTEFYNWHVELVRDFARKHPSITYIEVSLDDPNIGSILHAKTGIPSSCWGDCKPGVHTKCAVVAAPNATSESY